MRLVSAAHVFEPRGNLLFSFMKNLKQLANNTLVFFADQSSGKASLACSASSSNTMDIIVDVGWHIKVDDVGNVVDIKTSGSDIGGDQEGGFSRREEPQSDQAVRLLSIAVDGRGWEIVVQKESFQVVGLLSSLNKDDGQPLDTIAQIEQHLWFVGFFDPNKLLGHKFSGRTNTTNSQEDVVGQEFTGQKLDLFWECGRKHQGVAGAGEW